MARVEEWFDYWLKRHQQRHPIEWPDFDDAPAFYRGWTKLFAQHGVTREIADEASEAMMANPPKYRSEHPKAVSDACKLIFKERAKEGHGQTVDTIEAAKQASKDCDDCGGGGFTVRYRKLSTGPKPYLVFYCRCPYGRAILANHRTTAPDVVKVTHDLEDYPWLWDDHRSPPIGFEPPTIQVQRTVF